MATPPTLSTSAASTGVTGAGIIVLTWALGLLHVALPADVAGALMMLGTPVVHYLVTLDRHPAVPVAAPETKP